MSSQKKEKDRSKKSKALKIIGRIALALLALVFLLLLFIRSPWGQNIIIHKVVHYVSEKTNTKIGIDRLYLTFSGNAYVEGLYIEDQRGDTLLHSKALEASIPLLPLIKGDKIRIASLDWEGVVAKIDRSENTGVYNFDFLIDAFATDTTASSTSSAPPKVEIGTIKLNDFKVDFRDEVAGLDASLQLGNLRLRMKEIDLEQFVFHIRSASISNTHITYSQSKELQQETEPSAENTLPLLMVDQLTIENTAANYSSLPSKIEGQLNIGSFVLALPKADLANRKIALERLELHNSQVAYSDLKVTKQLPKDTTKTQKPLEFKWPNWEVEAGPVVMENNNITYTYKEHDAAKDLVTTTTLAISKLDLNMPTALLRNKAAEISLAQFSFYQKDGIALNNFGVDLKANDKGVSFTNIDISTPKSRLNGTIKIKYTSITDFLNKPATAQVSVAMPSLLLHLEEAYPFWAALKENEAFQVLAKKSVSGKLFLEGTLGNLQLQNTALQWGKTTALQLQGTLSNLMQTDSLYVDFPKLEFTTLKTDVAQFLNEEELGVTLPDSIQITAVLKGTLATMDAQAILKSPDGSISLDGNFSSKELVAFNGQLEVVQLHLEKLLNNEQLGPVSFTLNATGSGSSVNTLHAEVDTDFTELQWQGYDFSNLKLQGTLNQGKGNINLRFKDENLNAQMEAGLDLDSISSKVELFLNVIGADLSALGITKRDTKAQFKLQANFKGNADDFTLQSQIDDALLVYENTPYPVTNLKVNAASNGKRTTVDINSKIIQGELRSNSDITSLNKALKRHFSGYFKDTTAKETGQDPVSMKMMLAIKQDPVLEEVFVGGLKKMDTVYLEAGFNEAEQHLTANLSAPYINYNDSTLDSLHLDLEGTGKNLDVNFGWKAINSGPIAIPKISLSGTLKNQELGLNFDAYDGEATLAHIGATLSVRQDTLRLKIDPSNLMLNKQQWQIPESNHIVLAERFLELQDFKLQRNQQVMTLSSSHYADKDQDLSLIFENFRLSTFTSFLNPEENLAAGIVKGNLTFEDPYGDTGMVAKMEITQFSAMESDLGNLRLTANSKTAETYDFDLSLSGGDVNLGIKGDYVAAESGAQLNLNLLINEIKMKALAALAPESISQPTGSLAGEFRVNGTPANPKYEGNLRFMEAGLKVNSLNATFSLPQEEIKVDNKGIYFDDFSIADANNHLFHLDGSIYTEQLSNPSFDLKIKTQGFQPIKATKEDNELFYGTLKLNADLAVGGDLSVPKITGNLGVVEGSNLTFVVPESQLEVMEREGVVLFVNKENPDAIITKNTDSTATSSILRGLDVTATLNVADNATFKIVIDQRSGDNFEVTGKGEFDLDINPNGRTSLAGRYEVSSGHYEASLYNLVKRRFDIAPGSTLTWSGDPYNAELQVRAIYKLETSAAPLMATQTSAASSEIANKYRQKLPFLVYLNVEGVLLQPEISFNLDIPEDKQGSLGGDVYGRVQQLNNREEELNKQVFSLLVLNRFFPGSTSDGSSGGAASIAKDNVNKVLSGQLNQFSDKLIGGTGVELDFGLESFTDYQGDTPQERTQLDVNASKQLFNNRLIVQVGSEMNIEGGNSGAESTPVIGNVSVEYLLTENGRYRLKGFRKNEFESVIDGQLIVTGIALIFNKEFNEFKELFAKAIKEEAENEKK
ncbi:translocation/assembly module TamB domain-containing protein [Arenibacter amylolyticus]|uniref:translocation/assembly module TamB domain-containing protein n=1 Tax=Arenibacter amylolyticus TaxID=1406873 RepID=UPI000A39E6CC|nr:translocation/assembly module TamB domain-containing protein [Arenibacter amylolyticus]